MDIEKELDALRLERENKLSFDEWRELGGMLMKMRASLDVYVGEKWINESHEFDTMTINRSAQVQGMVVFLRPGSSNPLDGIDVAPREYYKVLLRTFKWREKLAEQEKEYKQYLSQR